VQRQPTTRGGAAGLRILAASGDSDRREPDAPSRGAQNALQVIGDPCLRRYPHPKLIATRTPTLTCHVTRSTANDRQDKQTTTNPE
jgi:hypothetical protein